MVFFTYMQEWKEIMHGRNEFGDFVFVVRLDLSIY